MAKVLLYHHIQGLTEGVRAFADELTARDAAHATEAQPRYSFCWTDVLDCKGIHHTSCEKW